MGYNKGVANNTMINSSDDTDVEQDEAASTNSIKSEQLTDDSSSKKNVSNSTEPSKVSLDMTVDYEPNSTATETRMENTVTCAYDDTSTELGEGASANTGGSEQLTNESTLSMNESSNSTFISSESSGDMMNMAVHHESISITREDRIEDIPTEDLIQQLFENHRATSDASLQNGGDSNHHGDYEILLYSSEYEHQSEDQYESMDNDIMYIDIMDNDIMDIDIMDNDIINEFQLMAENMDDFI